MVQVQYPLLRLVYYFVLELASSPNSVDSGLSDETTINGILWCVVQVEKRSPWVCQTVTNVTEHMVHI
jgi:hypothetical protein